MRRFDDGGLAVLDSDLMAGSDDETEAAAADDDDSGSVTASGGLSALDIPGAAQALKALATSSAEARKALVQAREQISARRYNKAIALFAASAALGAPTRAGSTAESFGAMSGALTGPLREKQEFERQRQKDILGIDTSISGIDEKTAMAQLQLAMLQAKMRNDLAKAPNDRIVLSDGTLAYRSHEQARQLGVKAWAPAAASTNVSLNTGKKFGETLSEGAGKEYTEQFKTALAAPQQIKEAQRVLSVLDKGAYTGMGADFKLALGKAARAVGLDYAGDDIANTEVLAATLAKSTLGMIKASGLGGGTGFSNADREFVEKASNGKIALDANSLRRLSKLNIRAHRNAMKTWNDSYGRLTKFPENKQIFDQIGYIPLEIPADPDEVAAPTAPSAPAVAPSTGQDDTVTEPEPNAIPSEDDAAATEPGTVSFHSLPKRK